MTQAVQVLNRYGTDFVAEGRGSDSECFAGFECFLNIVRALGMGSCISEVGAGGSPPLLTYSQELNVGDGGKRKRIRGSSTMDYKVPGRMFLNGSSDVASMYCKQGRKGVNQDAMLVWENFCSKEDTIFCGVFDGHGPYGHRVAKKVRDSFPLKLGAQWDLHRKNEAGFSNQNGAATSYNSEEQIRQVGKNFDLELDGSNTILALRESFLKASKIMDKELKLHRDIDCFCSGTTAVTLIKQGLNLVIANVGDSRAVLGTRDHEDSLIAVQLTIDLKPNLPKEEERIKQRKGRVFSLKNEPDVSRVWLPNSDFPGLAMARAFGDFCLKDVGLISVPDVSYHRLTEKDEFVVLATDGIWDVLSNEEVVEIVASAPQSTAARLLVESAVHAWRTKFPFCKVDDCAAVCLFLNSDSESKAEDTPDKLMPDATTDPVDQSSLCSENGIEAEAEKLQ
ncbi:probable protein phosphatase 2C 33 [Lathyrus oleraceus]|uniref:PPM-type phosphatase domain-containing protein n=1 Tax=Pisum sativum TaxID=3888 RepID=A0A9D4Y4J4_PEA|nr:probable protein phosphatase 2C 33 [Pisum sativum]XP_050913558.1 probable protein phosphatase 2C 33 [Pisum sativum]XP_050913559.1 probable protein phosphatase 2C 33 [Pisum sativum]KAI5431674.1 hypothetical protein KIW84_035728 [Pisum sativum]